MNKKMIAVMTAVLMLALFCLPVMAASTDENVLLVATMDRAPRLSDGADLLTDAEETALLQKLDEISERLQFDLVVVTASEMDGKDSVDYADDYYDENGFGFGEDRDGALLLLNMEDREWWISTCGSGIGLLPEETIDLIGEDMTPQMSDGDFYDAFVTFADQCAEYVAQPQADTTEPEDKSLDTIEAAQDTLVITDGAHPARLVDGAGLLSDEEEQLLTQKLDEVSERQKFDVVIVTASTLNGKSPMEYADDYYDYNGYGFGANNDGALLLVSMEDRDWWISTTGFGITAMTDFGIEKLGENLIKNGLSDGDYYQAFKSFASDCDSYVTQAKNGSPVDVNTYKAPFQFVKRIGTSAIIGLIVSLIVGSSLKGKMTSVKAAKAAAEYTRPGSFYLRDQSDVFLYNQVSRTAKPQETRSGGGGSSTHTSSSGTSHGGGGGKF